MAGLPWAREKLKCWRYISAARGDPLKRVGSRPQTELPSLQQQNCKKNPNNIRL